jgi:hypothetical protein
MVKLVKLDAAMGSGERGRRRGGEKAKRRGVKGEEARSSGCGYGWGWDMKELN